MSFFFSVSSHLGNRFQIGYLQRQRQHEIPQTMHRQEFDVLLKCELDDLYAYQPIFQLNDEEMSALRGFLRYWTILRRCCGMQASKYWRALLHGIGNATDILKPTYPACEVYNLSQVEHNFREFVRLSPHFGLLYQNTIFQQFNGTMCQSTIEKIASGFDFNGRKFLNNETYLRL